MSSPLHHQPPPPPPPAAGPGLPPPVMYSVPMLLPVLVLVFFLICFFSIFLLRDLLFYLSSRFRDGQAGANGGAQQDGGQGLDPTIISSFPTLPFSTVRRIQEGKCGAECAVCLAEFGTGDIIRLLTVCCHAFHPGCIDSWLESHTTCPTCRSDLHAPPDETAVLAVREAVEEGSGVPSHINISVVDEGSGVHSHVISVVDEEAEPKLNSMRRDGNVVRTTGTEEELS